MDVVVVPTTHWDREWYRTFQAFRARLVDTVDRVLELLASDDGYTFLLDGQSIVLEDYVEIRPGRRAELEEAIRSGRVEIGPWYVQPDSLLPSGESHVRNLLEGRRVGESFGPVTRVAYTPDSFGHPAQFPQIFAGFGLGHFVYWRGNADEIVELPAEYLWSAPDGSTVMACNLWRTYSNAAGLPVDDTAAVEELRRTVEALAARTRNDRVLLLAGTDHQPPESRTAELSTALAEATGWRVERGLLGGFVEGLSAEAPFSGELVGGRIANLLPGVWSTRTYMKVRNRTCETILEGWAEPWAALGGVLGCPDERPALRAAWRRLLQNQAHDSICGCSKDDVHEQMLARYDATDELGRETTKRMCERIAGLGVERRTPWTDELDIAVFNPSPHPRTDVVRFALDGYPPFDRSHGRFIHPLVFDNLKRQPGFTVDGAPARVVSTGRGDRVQVMPQARDFEVEFVAADVPAFGYRRFRLAPSDPAPDEEDTQRNIATAIRAGELSVVASNDGTLSVHFREHRFAGLGALEDVGDRGDTYDHDPVSRWRFETTDVRIRRARHPSGIQHLWIARTLAVPTLDTDRTRGQDRPRSCTVTTVARIVPGVERVDLAVQVDNQAPDHRLRILFPTGAPVDRFLAATTFDVAERRPGPADGSQWIHPAPATFCHQGFVSAGGLTVVAPGLYEGEVTPDGTIAITLLRAVGWLSRHDLTTRPEHAGPGIATPGAQSLRSFGTQIALLPGSSDPRATRDAELGLASTATGDTPLLPERTSLLELAPPELLLSALKPAEGSSSDRHGFVLRVLNPTGQSHEAIVRLGFDVTRARSVRLDETPDDGLLVHEGRELRFPVAAHGLRSILVQTGR